MAHTCAKQGAHLILASRDVDRLSKVSEECIRLGAASARVIAFDASVTDDCERLVEEAFPDGIDLLILNHAWSLWQHMDFGNPRANVDLVKALAATNYFGYVAIAQFALPRMTNVPGSKLLAVSSAASFVPIPSKTHAYSASKGAINNYFTALRSQLRIAGYRSPSVTLAFLGAINTEDFSVVVKDSLINKSTVSAESTG
ncbi:hypothetical protein BC938DRAFT_474420 [Jimgerdemannia flammicorona]|nr:hypothetical protein BC938DRAFT_474420 [Jimgerdemannia flammicorona]